VFRNVVFKNDCDGLITGCVRIWRRNRGTGRINGRFSFPVARREQQQQHSLFSQASWGRLEMKPERNKFKPGEKCRF